MNGIFAELLTPIQEYSFICSGPESGSFINLTTDFTIIKIEDNQWEWSPTYEMWHKQGVASEKVYEIFHQAKEIFSTREEAKKDALLSFKAILPNYFPHISQQLKRKNNTNPYYIRNNANPHLKINNLYMYGRSGQWILLSSMSNKDCFLKSISHYNIKGNYSKFKTRKQLLLEVLTILSCNLEQIYDKDAYNYSLEHSFIEDKDWWTLFIKPDINLTKIFSS